MKSLHLLFKLAARWFLMLLILNGTISHLFATVQKMNCPMNRDYYLYLPGKIDPNRTYWLVCYVHGSNGHAQSDVASLQDFVARGDCIGVAPSFAKGFQLLKNGTDEQLIGILHQLSQQYKLHTKIFVFGHSAGGQFSHRFTLRHPDYVIGCEACSSGTWATGGVYQSLTQGAKTIPIAIGCGEEDRGEIGTTIAILGNGNAEDMHSTRENHHWGVLRMHHHDAGFSIDFPGVRCANASSNHMERQRSEDPGWNRIEWFQKFSQLLEQGNFFFKAKTFPNELHDIHKPEQEDLAMEAFLLGTCGMLPQERATYDATIATIKKNIAAGTSDITESDFQKLQDDVTTRSKDAVRKTLLSQGWYVNEAALDQCLLSAQQFVNEETIYLQQQAKESGKARLTFLSWNG